MCEFFNKTYKMQTILIGLTLLVSYCNGFIVPQELPSVLSLVYSNIPPIKKGTDSRVGFGFRLGEHADFQVMLEIGPQRYTKPIGKPFSASADDDGSNTSKRMADLDEFNNPIKTSQPSVSGNNYIQKWANEMKAKSQPKTTKPQIASAENDSLKALFSTRNQYPLPVSPVIAESSLRQLQQLMYAKDAEKGSRPVGTLPSKTMETHLALAARNSAEKQKEQQKIKADLSDVSLDD